MKSRFHFIYRKEKKKNTFNSVSAERERGNEWMNKERKKKKRGENKRNGEREEGGILGGVGKGIFVFALGC